MQEREKEKKETVGTKMNVVQKVIWIWKENSRIKRVK